MLKRFVLFRYLSEVWSEAAKVTWPTRIQTVRLTIIVLVVSVAVSAYAFGLDVLFQYLMRSLVE